MQCGELLLFLFSEHLKFFITKKKDIFHLLFLTEIKFPYNILVSNMQHNDLVFV